MAEYEKVMNDSQQVSIYVMRNCRIIALVKVNITIFNENYSIKS